MNDAITGLKSKIEMEVSLNNQKLKFKEEREMERLFKSFWELEKRIESQNDYISENLNGFRATVAKCEEE